MIENVAAVDPPGTVTEDGTLALVLLDESGTAIPPLGAGPDRVTVPVDPVPPVTAAGLTVRLLRDGALIVSAAVFELPPMAAVIVALTVVATAVVVIVKVAEVDPLGTVTVPGRVAFPLLEVSVTAVPPVGAAPERVTVPVEGVPPVTVAGDTVTETT